MAEKKIHELSMLSPRGHVTTTCGMWMHRLQRPKRVTLDAGSVTCKRCKGVPVE